MIVIIFVVMIFILAWIKMRQPLKSQNVNYNISDKKQIKMTKEEKQLLLKDLCSRLPYGVKVCYKISDKDSPIIETLSGHMLDYFNENCIVEVKPYLRPMSSITEEEGKKYDNKIYAGLYSSAIDYLNSIHIDYRGLIPMGLALEAPEGMYKDKID